MDEHDDEVIVVLVPGDGVDPAAWDRVKLDIARSVADAVKAHGLRVLVGELPAERPATAARCPWWTNGDSWALWAGPPSTLQCVLVSGHGGDHRATY